MLSLIFALKTEGLLNAPVCTDQMDKQPKSAIIKGQININLKPE